MQVSPRRRVSGGLRYRLIIVLASASFIIKTGHAFDISDPFNTMDEVSTSPAKNVLPENRASCELGSTLPVPLKLSDAVEWALCNNPQTHQAWATVKAQAAAKGTGWSAYLPTIDARGHVMEQKRAITYSGHPEFSTNVSSENVDGSINLNWVLYDFGLRSANLESARQLLNAANAAQDNVLQTVFINTVQAFYDAQSAQALLASLKEAEKAAEKSFKAAEAKYDAGVGTLADKLQAQTSYAQATLKRVQAEGDLQTAVGGLASVMGLRPNNQIEIAGMADEAVDEPLFHKAVDDLIEQAVRDHPKILAAKAQVEAAQAKVDAVKAQGRPTLSIVGDYTQTHASAIPINNQGSSRQTVNTQEIGLQLTIPLFEGLGRHYKIKEAEAQAESKEAELGNTEQQVSLDVWKYFQALRTEAENLKVTKTLVISAKQSFDVAQGRYKVGVGNIIELLKAQSDLASADQQRLLALTRWQTSRLKLATSLGQLSYDDIKDN